jgi:para-aminobenzoate synthetase component 1
MYARAQAIETMNSWGAKQTPFLFVIDFEMQKIKLFRTDQGLPEGIMCYFPEHRLENAFPNERPSLQFQKHPVSYPVYQEAFQIVMEQILAGNSFLLNLTFPTKIATNLTMSEIYSGSTAKYKLFLKDELVCFSPETFVTIRNGQISSYPMKGTIKATVPGAMEVLLNDPKETAEHHTIVDLIRNDLSMVASDISVKRFRYVENVSTHEGDILQVSSEITGKLPRNFRHHLGDIIFALLPAGSVTGAPKQKTVSIIELAEGAPRGYYTGIFGYFDGKNMDSAVMIRFIENRNGDLWFRSGGGITCNSNAESEYRELIDKVYVPIV